MSTVVSLICLVQSFQKTTNHFLLHESLRLANLEEKNLKPWTLMKCCIVWHFIWVFTVCQNMLLGLTNKQMFNLLSVCQRWRLHFEFVTSVEPIKEPERPTKPDETSTWRGPATVAVETMVWDLPIKIFPANPVHASSVTLLKTVNGICV